MMLKTLKRIIISLLILPILYVIVSLILSLITINATNNKEDAKNYIFLSTNGVHLDIIIPKSKISRVLASDLKFSNSDQFLSFGWGDENFYINTPTWNDLTFTNAFKALFLKSTTLIHLTKYKTVHKDWVKVYLNDEELDKLNFNIMNTFKYTKSNQKIILLNKGYGLNDDFYYANGSYSCFNTCNSWVNSTFKRCGLKSCLWTPFDFGLLNKYE